jgi:hypothetical protein
MIKGLPAYECQGCGEKLFSSETVDIIQSIVANCSFNRPFDDQTQMKIRLETEAKLFIQNVILNGEVELVWSYILDFENSANPYEQRIRFMLHVP